MCSVGRLIDWKNHAFLIRGFAEYRKWDPSSTLLLVGDGPERNNLERLARNLDVASNVKFVGHSDQAKEILAGSDIFVLPSDGEPFGRVTLEAMALIVPVIATWSGGSRELVRDRVTGLLVSLNDVDELRVALRTLCTDGELRRRITANAYEATQNEFDIVNSVASIERIYRAVPTSCSNPERVMSLPGHTW